MSPEPRSTTDRVYAFDVTPGVWWRIRGDWVSPLWSDCPLCILKADTTHWHLLRENGQVGTVIHVGEVTP